MIHFGLPRVNTFLEENVFIVPVRCCGLPDRWPRGEPGRPIRQARPWTRYNSRALRCSILSGKVASPAFVATALKRAGLNFIYPPAIRPDHPDFHFQWANNLDCRRHRHFLQCIFVASRKPLVNSNLTLLLSTSTQKTKSRFVPLATSAVHHTWLDVGAHLGEKTWPAAQNDPTLRAYAFEPNLSLVVERMGLLTNFVVLPLAVAEHDGSAEFHLNTFEAASSLLQ
jgi:hypothetical protein